MFDAFWHAVGKLIDWLEGRANKPVRPERIAPLLPKVPADWPGDDENTP